jgi:RNA polymerase sigma-70 factor (ECF subfamily)
MGAAALVEGLRAGQPAAIAAFYQRYSAQVLRLLGRVLGAERELADLHHDVFVRALGSIGSLEDPEALTAWLNSVTVFTARSEIQRRMRRRWLVFRPPEELPEVEAPARGGEAGEALRATYAALNRLPADDRIAFVLRYIEGMELGEAAAACGVSLATIKRRIARAEAGFLAIARESAVLGEWLEGGSRWGGPSER